MSTFAYLAWSGARWLLQKASIPFLLVGWVATPILKLSALCGDRGREAFRRAGGGHPTETSGALPPGPGWREPPAEPPPEWNRRRFERSDVHSHDPFNPA